MTRFTPYRAWWRLAYGGVRYKVPVIVVGPPQDGIVDTVAVTSTQPAGTLLRIGVEDVVGEDLEPSQPVNSLQCRKCGELGRLRRRITGGIFVTCTGKDALHEGLCCCRTGLHATDAEALYQWSLMHASSQPPQ